MYNNKKFDDLIFNADRRIINQSDRMILRAYAHYSDSKGRSTYPSFQTVADKAKISRDTVRKRVKRLADLELLQFRGISEYETNKYDLNIAYLEKCQEGTSLGDS